MRKCCFDTNRSLVVVQRTNSLEDPESSSGFVNELSLIVDAQRYLEIGVARGKTFCDVKIANKVAVDPNFRFDTGTRPKNEQFYEMESNSWFSTRDGSDRFDVIFIDGLHTFGQAFRDFCNALLMAHARTIWLIDDTVPADIYSAWPNQKEAVELRRAETGSEGKGSGAWNGDVYKLVFAIHDFFPLLSYRTTASAPKPKTVVWRQPRREFTPLFNSIEPIERLTFFDYRKNKAIMKEATKDAILQELSAYFGKPWPTTPLSSDAPALA